MVRASPQARRDVTGEAPPLILTAELPPDLHRLFTALRRDNFPPEKNFLEAHVTLFHALSGANEGELCRMLGRLAAEFAPIAGRVDGVMPLGQGTAIRISSPDMLTLRELIADRFHGLLTAQDRGVPRLHVTIQNKVSPIEAKALQSRLAATIEQRNFRFPGLSLHRYAGGPWQFVRRWPFRGK